MSLLRFKRLFRERLAAVRERRPELDVRYRIGRREDFPETRDYAVSLWDSEAGNGGRVTLIFAPKIKSAPADRQDALIRHELAHAVLQSAGLEHDERECDTVAEALFGDEIYYDHQDVQTLNEHARGATRPRPARLPDGR